MGEKGQGTEFIYVLLDCLRPLQDGVVAGLLSDPRTLTISFLIHISEWRQALSKLPLSRPCSTMTSDRSVLSSSCPLHTCRVPNQTNNKRRK